MSLGPIDAVLFDFSRTLFCVEEPERWLARAARSIGLDLANSASDLVGRLLAAGRPGGSEPTTVPERLRAVYARRDLSTEDHRAAYVGLLSTVDLPDPRLADALYDRLYIPDGWVPYADAGDTIQALRDRGIATAVVSNIAWDLRPLLRAYHLDLFDQYVFSHEVGVQKPDPEIFTLACAKLGVAPERTLMVGDHVADGAAVDSGIRSLLLPATPPGTVHGLAAAVALVDHFR